MTRFTSIPLLAVVLVAAALTGCGGDDPAGDQQSQTGTLSADQPVAVSVGETAGIPTAFMRFGVAKGFFSDEGLDVEVVPVQGAAPIVTGVVSGDYTMGGSDTQTFAQAVARGLPLLMIAPGTSVDEDPESDFSSIMVAEDSPIREPADLRGSTIAINTLGNITQVTTAGALDELGVDPDAVDYAEIPFPEMTAAVSEGEVDAAFVIEPFRTIALSAGLREVFPPFSRFQPGLQIGSIVTTRSYAEENPEVVDAFQRAHARTATYIGEHPEEFRQALPEIAEIEPKLAEAVNLPVWKDRVDVPSVQRVAEAMVRYGFVDEQPQVTEAIAEGA
ncbi:MAG: ABC transporter substrate-binding protein [Actinobacteria bacterium]|nr:ABC transporter substrate-binding protein [Actinomycetota bacterium]